MVATETAGVPKTAVNRPSMGPSSIPYVPPITMGEAVVRARVRIRLRNRRGSLALVVAVILLGLPLILAMAALFPQEAGAEVPLVAYLEFLGMTAATVFLALAVYRILRDRTLVTYPVLAVGAALLLYGLLQIVLLLQRFLAWNPTDTSLPADPNAYFVAMVLPGLIFGAGILAVLAGGFALPRRVDVARA